MLNPPTPGAPDFTVLFIIVAVIAAGAAGGMYFWQREYETPGHRRREWTGRILIPVGYLLVAGFAIAMTTSIVASDNSPSVLMATEIEKVYGLDVTVSQASALLDGDPAVIDGVAYRIEDDRLVEATAWEDSDVAE